MAAVAASVAGAALVTACSSAGSLVADRNEPASPQVAKVVVLVPDEGGQAANGAGVMEAVELVLGEVEIPGWVVEVERVADGGNGAGARSVAEGIAADHDVIAVVGGLTAAAVRASQPELDRARIPFLSPADENLEHTRGADPVRPHRPYDGYFRVAVPDLDPRGFAAEYLVHGLGADPVAVIQDGRLDEAAAFARQARQLGADVVTGEPGDVDDGVSTARRAGASAIYVAGDGAFAAEVAAAVDRARLDATIVGGTDLLSAEFLAAAGTAAAGAVSIEPATLAPSAGLPAPALRRAGAFGAAAVDAGTALADALERCLPPVRETPARAARRGCTSELGTVSFDGLTGIVSFDAFGERPGALPRASILVDGEWRPSGSL